MNEPRCILVVRLSALGDVLLATPAIRALARRYPSSRINWLVEEAYVPLLAQNPYARAIPYRKKGEHAGIRGLIALRRALMAEGYDLIVDLQNKPKTRLLRTVAPRCIAWSKRTPSEAILSLVRREKPLTRAHAVELFLEPLRVLGVEDDGRNLDLRLSKEAEARAASALPAGRLAGIAPGARWATKRWPAQRFAAVVEAVARRGFEPILLGGPGDADALAKVRALVPFALPDTAGLDVGGLAAAIARCAVVVAGDSGPVHVASALGTPVVALFGPTSPERWRPLSPRSEVVRTSLACSPCSNHGDAECPAKHHECMRSIEVEDVVAAIDRVTR